MSFVDVCMNGRSVVQIIVRQRRRRRVRRLAIAVMLHEKTSYRGDQIRGCCGKFMASQRTGECVVHRLEECNEFSLIFFYFVYSDEDCECCSCNVPKCRCRPTRRFKSAALRPSRVLDRYRFHDNYNVDLKS